MVDEEGLAWLDDLLAAMPDLEKTLRVEMKRSAGDARREDERRKTMARLEELEKREAHQARRAEEDRAARAEAAAFRRSKHAERQSRATAALERERERRTEEEARRRAGKALRGLPALLKFTFSAF